MVEDIEELELELRFHFFRDAEILEQRQIGIEEPRATEGVAPDTAELVASWLTPRSAGQRRTAKTYGARVPRYGTLRRLERHASCLKPITSCRSIS